MKLQRIDIGVIGMGGNWRERYKPALLLGRDRFAIRAVCDPVYYRASVESERLECVAADGFMALMNLPGIEAILWVDADWSGLWPVEQACRLGRPILCIPPVTVDWAHAAAVIQQVGKASAPVWFPSRLRYAPATIRLRRLLKSHLGQPRLLLAEIPRSDSAGGDAWIPDLYDVILWCLHLAESGPRRVSNLRSSVGASVPLESFLIEFDQGMVAQLNLVPSVDETIRIRVIATAGEARLRFPDQLVWYHRRTQARERFRGLKTAEERILRRFHQMVVAAKPAGNEVAHAVEVMQACQDSRRSGHATVQPLADT